MPSTFTPSDLMDPSKEKDWAANLGMLDWDNTKIVFTKRTLIEFLKYTGITVDTNFANIQKLPRYAEFGKLEAQPDASVVLQSAADISVLSTDSNAFKPSRRVRTVPGGQHTDIFATDYEDDALSTAPPRDAEQLGTELEIAASTHSPTNSVEAPTGIQPVIKPSRRVRTNPGGNSSIGNLWSDEDPEEFKPSRRVRQGPGGQDSIAGIF